MTLTLTGIFCEGPHVDDGGLHLFKYAPLPVSPSRPSSAPRDRKQKASNWPDTTPRDTSRRRRVPLPPSAEQRRRSPPTRPNKRSK